MKITTSIVVKIEGYPKYDNKKAFETPIADYALDYLLSEEYAVNDLYNRFRCAFADASYDITKDLMDSLKRIKEEKKAVRKDKDMEVDP